jgi:hypothetical protein
MILFSAYPAGSISPTFGPQYRYYPIYPGPVLPHHQGSEGQPVTNAPTTSNQSENASKDSNSGEGNNDTVEELSELVQEKLNVDSGGDKESSAEGEK